MHFTELPLSAQTAYAELLEQTQNNTIGSGPGAYWGVASGDRERSSNGVLAP